MFIKSFFLIFIRLLNAERYDALWLPGFGVRRLKQDGVCTPVLNISAVAEANRNVRGNPHRVRILSIGVIMCLLATADHALADCNNAILRTTPDQAFTIHDDGTVTHNTTGLMWMRCLLGQTWNDEACIGSAQSYSWGNALQAADGYTFAGYNDWRLPNKNELASIVERACFKPAINITAFPNTPASLVWSSSPYANLATYAGFVNFNSGNVGGDDDVDFLGNHVRLVRGGQ